MAQENPGQGEEKQAVVASDTAERVGRAGRSLDGQREGQPSFPGALTAESWEPEPQPASWEGRGHCLEKFGSARRWGMPHLEKPLFPSFIPSCPFSLF